MPCLRCRLLAGGAPGTSRASTETHFPHGSRLRWHRPLRLQSITAFWLPTLPGTNSQAVAEGAVALMLSLTRNVTMCDRLLRGGEWYNRFLSRELTNSCIGIVGYGNIGKRVITLLQGFTHKVFVYDPFVQTAIEGQKYVTFTTLEQLAQDSDVISLHLPLSGKTRHLVDGISLPR